MRLRRSVGELLVCCIALWVGVSSSSSGVKAPPPPGCDSMLSFSSEVSSFSVGQTNVNRRSLSPWRWRSSTVKNRVPSTLWEAECIDAFCSGLNKHSLVSVPIYQSVLVLNRQQGAHCYTASYLSVAVGCTCVWAKTSQN
ncbi:interleukin 17a/f2 [Hippoglossus stenolepis]|uniref:interleukin 17a/f2 n=1 Tax=Hippoglossus stenolepis TaxID=195615 RepID=UPI001FAEC85B|nr:interleukin 17a/f2 [Hippoglossus stenolepis]